MPRAASIRASAVSDPHPSPSALMCVDRTTERPALNSSARRSIASFLSLDTVSRSTTRFVTNSDSRVRLAVQEIDSKSQSEPDEEPDPGVCRQAVHHVAADQDRKDRHERDQRRTERTLYLRAHAPQHDYPGGHDHERQ